MKMLNVLFVCSQNVCRSVTGELYFRAYHPQVWVRSCGSDRSATVPINKWLCVWANVIFCFEMEHKIATMGYDHDAEVILLNVPNNYVPNDPDLIRILDARVKPILDEHIAKLA